MPGSERNAPLFVSQVACILSFSSGFLSLFPHLFLFQEPLPGPCLKKKGGGGEEEEGNTLTPISRKKKKKKKTGLFLDRLEPRSWRPGEVRGVWRKELAKQI